MSAIPSRPLGEVCRVVGGGTPSRSRSDYFAGDIPWATVGDMNTNLLESTAERITSEAVDESATNVIPEGNVIIATRVGLGKVCLLAQDTAINQDLRGIIPMDASRLSERYLFWWFRSIADQIVGAGTGATVQGVKVPFVKSLQVPMLSLAEQQRIVAILDQAFEGIAITKALATKNTALAQELAVGELESTLLGRGGHWERVTLADLLERGWILEHMDGNHGSDYPRKSEFIAEGVPYLSAKCIVNEQVNIESAKHLSSDRAGQLRKGFAQDGDVLFAHNATVGPVAILHTDEETVVLGTSLTYYRCNREHILPEYLAHYMRSDTFKSQYLQVMRQSTRNQVPITKQREFVHVIPPIEEQAQIAVSMDELFAAGHSLESIYQLKLGALDALKESLLNEAFTGNL